MMNALLRPIEAPLPTGVLTRIAARYFCVLSTAYLQDRRLGNALGEGEGNRAQRDLVRKRLGVLGEQWEERGGNLLDALLGAAERVMTQPREAFLEMNNPTLLNRTYKASVTKQVCGSVEGGESWWMVIMDGMGGVKVRSAGV